MDLKRKQTGSKKHIWKASMIGTLTGIIVSCLLTIAIAAMINNGRIKEDSLGVFSYIIWSVSVMAGTLLAQKKTHSMKFAAASATAIFYVIALCIIAIIIFDGNVSSIGKGIVITFLSTIPSLIAILKRTKKESVKFKI